MKVLTFGEIMLRLKTPENLRIVQSDAFEAIWWCRGKCCGIFGNVRRSGGFFDKIAR